MENYKIIEVKIGDTISTMVYIKNGVKHKIDRLTELSFDDFIKECKEIINK